MPSTTFDITSYQTSFLFKLVVFFLSPYPLLPFLPFQHSSSHSHSLVHEGMMNGKRFPKHITSIQLNPKMSSIKTANVDMDWMVRQLNESLSDLVSRNMNQIE